MLHKTFHVFNFRWKRSSTENFLTAKISQSTVCKSMMMSMGTNIVAVQLTFPVLASNCSHCHLAYSVFDTIIIFYLMLIYPSLCKYGIISKKVASEIECVYQLYHWFCSATPLD